MNSLTARIISAISLIVIVALLFYFFGKIGLEATVFIIVILGSQELIKILFQKEESLFIKAFFYLFVVALFIFSTWSISYGGLAFAILSIFILSIGLLLQNRFKNLHSLEIFQAKSILGLLYLGLIPSFTCKLIELNNGMVWFITLLFIVSAGDTFAYVFGLLWGKNKIAPQISPKKTVVGSWGGILGSVFAGLIMLNFLDHVSLIQMTLLSIVCSIFGQFGDLFESMLKRVADIKDSGTIIPGHGGILDRIDGILFAAPILYAFAVYIEN